MTDPKKRDKPQVKTRPAGKLPSGFDRPARVPDGSQVAEILGLAAKTDQTPTTHSPTTDHTPASHPVAPEKNFARVPNSVAFEAIPAGLFRGESFKTYHALYQRTRAAVVPRRSIRATKADVMEWADVSHNTLKVHLRYLEAAGLVKVHYRRGDRDGMDFEVFIPEERQTTHQPDTHQPPTTYTLQSSQNLGTQTTQNLGVVGESQPFSFQRPTDPDKTSLILKTEKLDDEAFAKLRAAMKDSTGREVASAALAELDELLATEYRLAAGRTESISAPGNFLAEHLRRRLWKKGKDQLDAERASEGESEQVAAVKRDISKCPDCFGTSHFYPDGFDKGVARCHHEKLSTSE